MTAPSNAGYDGNLFEQDWARLSADAGEQELVESGLVPSAVPAGTRQVALTAGVAYAWGVRTKVGATTVTFPNVTSGVRWDTVALRRNWANDDAHIVVVSGRTAEALAAGLKNEPGVEHDQPLALVQITAGQTVPTEVKSLAGPRWHKPEKFARPIVSGEEDQANVADGETWPSVGGFAVYVPRRAKTVVLHYEWLGANNQGGNPSGYLWLQFDQVLTQRTNYSAAGSDQNRQTLGTADTITIPTASKGRWVNVLPKANRLGTTDAMLMDAGCSVVLSVDFKE